MRTCIPSPQVVARCGVVAFAVAFLFGCAEGTTTPPPSQRPVVPKAPSHFVSVDDVDDPCFTDDTDWSCHVIDGGYEVSYDDYDTDPDDANDWDIEDCPDGCTTYPLGTKTKAKVLDELQKHIKNEPNCQAVKTWVLNMVSNWNVRFYPNRDGNWGDIHTNFWGTPTQIHLYANNFIPGNEYQLGITLMHEGYHGYNNYYYDPPDNPAQNFAESCVTP